MLPGGQGSQKPRLQLGVPWAWVLSGRVLVCLKLGGGVSWAWWGEVYFGLSGVLASCGPNTSFRM